MERKLYPLLLENVAIRNLEAPVLYDYSNDEMFELDNEAFNAVKLFNGNRTLEEISKISGSTTKDLKKLTDYLIKENLLTDRKVGEKAKTGNYNKSPVPSLRTILVHITTVCNLDCVHCYVDKSQKLEMTPEIFYDLTKQFYKLQGLKILISGGEPLTHSKFFEMMEQIKKIKIRKVLLTNGILLNQEKIQHLRDLVQEVQISLDGTKSHDQYRRMKNAFNLTLNNIKLLKDNNFTVSISTMIHSKNLNELPELEKILKDTKVDNWYLDVPTVTKEYKNNPTFHLDPYTAGKILSKYGWGKQFYYEDETHACGTHLGAVMADGDVAKCGFFEEQPVGNIKNKSLKECWKLIKENYIWKQKQLKCNEIKCEYLKECKGGCRYRALIDTDNILGIDRVKCSQYNANSQ
jgi:radical SAM protein with 4Fe4S-binding SPASM domain